MGAHQAPPSLGFSRQEHWSGLPFPSPMHESEKWKWSRPVMSDSSRPHGPQPTRPLCPWDFPGKSTGVGCHCLLRQILQTSSNLGCSQQNSWPSRTPIYHALLAYSTSGDTTATHPSMLIINVGVILQTSCPSVCSICADIVSSISSKLHLLSSSPLLPPGSLQFVLLHES